MNLVELSRALRQLRLSGMADVLETRLLQAQTEQQVPSTFSRRSSVTSSCDGRIDCRTSIATVFDSY
jgi:hypothetical protein